MRLSLILNRSAGTLRGLDPDKVVEDLAGIFRSHGHEVEFEALEGADAIAAIERSCQDRSFDAVVVGGGDGTISAAAAFAAEQGATLGVLPLGTMNLFARSLGVPLAMQAAAESIATGRKIGVDIAEVNGRLFVHHVTIGLHARMILLRRAYQYSSRLGKLKASLQAWWIAVRNPPRIDARIRADEATFHRRSAAILVSNNPLGEGHIPYADDPREGRLGLYVANSLHGPDLIRLAVRLSLGHVRSNPLLDRWTAREVDIELAGESIGASVDGEIVTLQSPLRCRQRRRGLSVLMPGTKNAD